MCVDMQTRVRIYFEMTRARWSCETNRDKTFLFLDVYVCAPIDIVLGRHAQWADSALSLRGLWDDRGKESSSFNPCLCAVT